MKIIRIGAIWCPGCLAMKKKWKNIEEKYPNLNIIDLDCDTDLEEIRKYNPGKLLPITIFLDENNNELERLIGEQKEQTIIDIIERKYHEKN